MTGPLDAAVVRIAVSRARRRRGALLAIGLVTLLGSTVTMAAAAGTRHAASALDRALATARVADVAIDVRGLDDERLAAAASRPEVADLTAVAFTALRPAGTTLRAGIDLAGLAPLDPDAGVSMDRPQVVDGRVPDPDRANEVALDPGLAERLDLEVGDELTLETFRQDQLEALFVEPESVTPAGPRFTARVVGLIRTLEEITSDNQGRFGVVALSAAGWQQFGTPDLERINEGDRAGMGVFRVLLRARLVDGSADADAFVNGLAGVFGRGIDATFSQSQPDVFAAADDTLDVETAAMGLFALGAALATVVAAGQAASRLAAAADAADGPVLRGLGATRGERIVAATLPALGAAAVGVLLAAPLAVLVSPLTRFGLVDRIDVDRGVLFDPAITALAALLIITAIGVQALVAARRSLTQEHVRAAGLPAPGGSSSLLALSLGVRTALTRSRWSLVVAAGTVAAITTVALFASSLDHLTRTPPLYGFGWDEDIVLQADGETIAARERPLLAADDRVAGLAAYQIFEISFGGDDRLGGLAVDVVEGDVGPTVLAGRLPAAVDEIAIDPSALAEPRPAIGDLLRTPDLSDDAELRVVGLLTGTGLGQFVVGPETAERLNADVSEAGFLVTWADGVDVADAETDLQRRFAEVEAPRPTAEVLNLQGVRGVPLALGGFFALVGLVAVGQALFVAGRHQGHDLAVTRALGLTRRQATVVLVSEGVTVGAVGVIVGLVLGVALGRRAWQSVADGLQVIPVATTPVLAIAAVALVLIGVIGTVTIVGARTTVGREAGPDLRSP